MSPSQNSSCYQLSGQTIRPTYGAPDLSNGSDTLAIVFGTLATVLAAATLILAGVKYWLRASQPRAVHIQSDVERVQVVQGAR